MSGYFRILYFFVVFLASNCQLSAQSFSSVITGIQNNYYSPGDTIGLNIAIAGSNFNAGNYLQYAFAPLGIQSSSQLIPTSFVGNAFISQVGSYTGGLLVGSNVSYGSYLIFGQSSSPSTIDTVAYITIGPNIEESDFKESIVGLTEYCYGDQVQLSIDSIPYDSALVDIPVNFPSGNVLWLPFSNSVQEYQSLQLPSQIGLGYSLQPNRDNFSNSSYYINSTNSALLYNQSPNVALMSSYQGVNDSSEFAISFWVQRDSCSNGILFGRIDSLQSGSFACYLTDSCTIGFVGAFSTQSFQISIERVEAAINGSWNHVIVEKSNGKLRLYINGQQKDASTLNSALYSAQPLSVIVGAPMSLLSDTITLPGAFAALDDMGFWSRALSSSEKQTLYSATTYGMTNSKAYHWSTGVLDTACSLTLLSDTLIHLTVIDDAGVTYSDSILIFVNQPQILGQTEACIGDPIQLAVVNQGYISQFQYTWSTGDTIASIINNFASSQNVWVESDGANSTCYDTIGVVINSLPNAAIIQEMPFNNSQTNIKLICGSGNHPSTTYIWNSGHTGASIDVYPSQSTWFTATVNSPEGCWSTDSVYIEVEAKTFIVNLENQDVSNTPHIAGNFNGWNTSSDSLTHIGGYLWAKTVQLVKQDTIAFKFINGDSWQDPHDWTSCSPLAYQSMGNRYMIVESTVDTIGPFQLSSCNNFPVVDIVVQDSVLACFGDTVKLMASSLLDSVKWQTGSDDFIYSLPNSFNGQMGVVGYYSSGVRLIDTITVWQDSYIDTSITVLGSLDICSGDTTTLALNPSFQVHWHDSTSLSIRDFHSTDTVYATLTSLLGCSANTDTLIITEGDLPDVNLTVSSNNICDGDTAYVSVPFSPNTSYLWSNQSTNSQTRITTTSAVFVIATDTNSGCNAQSSIVIITSHSVPNAPIIFGDTIVSVGDTLKYSIQNVNSSYDYSWSLIGPGGWHSSSSDSTLVEIIWNNSGSAILEASASNAYCSNSSITTIFISSIGIGDIVKSNIQLFPNPTQGRLVVQGEEALGEYAIYNMVGAIVASGTTSDSEAHFDLSGLPSGVYWLNIAGERYRVVLID